MLLASIRCSHSLAHSMLHHHDQNQPNSWLSHNVTNQWWSRYLQQLFPISHIEDKIHPVWDPSFSLMFLNSLGWACILVMKKKLSNPHRCKAFKVNGSHMSSLSKSWCSLSRHSSTISRKFHLLWVNIQFLFMPRRKHVCNNLQYACHTRVEDYALTCFFLNLWVHKLPPFYTLFPLYFFSIKIWDNMTHLQI